MIQRLLRKQASGWAGRAVKQGLLSAMRTASGRPRAIYTLAPWGIEIAQQCADLELPYHYLDCSRIPQHLIRHGLITQSLTLDALQAAKIIGYYTEREWSTKSPEPSKLHDAVWLTDSGLRIGLEVELSPKWHRQLDTFFGATLDGLTPRDGQPSSVDAVVIASDSPALLNRYRAAICPGAELPTWTKNSRGHWISDDHRRVIREAAERIEFMLIPCQLL